MRHLGESFGAFEMFDRLANPSYRRRFAELSEVFGEAFREANEH
jgi:hypothetical protein